MYRGFMIFTLAGMLALAATSSRADNWKDESGQGKWGWTPWAGGPGGEPPDWARGKGVWDGHVKPGPNYAQKFNFGNKWSPYSPGYGYYPPQSEDFFVIPPANFGFIPDQDYGNYSVYPPDYGSGFYFPWSSDYYPSGPFSIQIHRQFK